MGAFAQSGQPGGSGAGLAQVGQSSAPASAAEATGALTGGVGPAEQQWQRVLERHRQERQQHQEASDVVQQQPPQQPLADGETQLRPLVGAAAATSPAGGVGSREGGRVIFSGGTARHVPFLTRHVPFLKEFRRQYLPVAAVAATVAPAATDHQLRL
jgi:hypothetical protein